ncbi:hypothetical protein [Coleofasciculus sp.]|uniref:hypothetical protein n=1 Tax=Coleofasciculus sp. TaxID=3100458 RepID=UPI003A3B6F49
MSFREPIRKKNFSPLSLASASNPLQRRRFKVPKPPKQVVRRSPEEQKAFLQQKLEQSAFVGYNGLNVPVKAPEPPPPLVQKHSASGALENNSQQPEIPEVETTSEQEEQTAQPKEKLSSEASSQNPESPDTQVETEGVTPDEQSEAGSRKHQSQIPDLQAQKQRASHLRCNLLEIPVNAPGTEAGKKLPAKSITPLVQRSASGTTQTSPEQEPKKAENSSEDTASARELLRNARDNWNEAKRRYVPRGKMSPLLKLRTEVVGKIITDIQTNIQQETQTPVDAEITSNNKSVAKLPAEPQPAFKPIAPGSGDPTSDYDVTFSAGRGEKKAEIKAVERFNQLFRGEWKKESGTVFDTNVYTTGHMPKASSNTPTVDAFGATNKEIKDLENKEKKGTITEEEKLRLPHLRQEQNYLKEQLGTEIDEEKENKWRNPAFRDKFNRDQDIMSLVKIRRFMSPREWNRYKKDMLKPYQRVPGQETLYQETEWRLTAAENFYNDRESDLQVKLSTKLVTLT